MAHLNPLVQETVHGLARPGPVHRACLDYLALQAVVLMLWWPKSALSWVLARGDGPDTLLAAVLALGLASAYLAARLGGEEILLIGQHPLREWALESRLGLGRVLAGYVGAHLVQMGYALALAAPLLVSALCVAAVDADVVAWCVAAVLVHATFYRLLGALVYLWIGHRAQATFFVLRLALVVGYAGAFFSLPGASHPIAAHARITAAAPIPGEVVSPGSGFLLVYIALSAVLLGVLHRRLGAERGRLGAVAGAPPGPPPPGGGGTHGKP